MLIHRSRCAKLIESLENHHTKKDADSIFD